MLIEMARATYQAGGIFRHGRSTRSHTVSVTVWKYLEASAALVLLMAVYTRSGCGLRMRPRKELRGRVLSSARSAYARGSLVCCATRLCSSCRSPNVMAPVGHAWAHAVVTSPSAIGRR